jgi:hypothetical protein
MFKQFHLEQAEAFKDFESMLKRKGLIRDRTIELISSWRHLRI